MNGRGRNANHPTVNLKAKNAVRQFILEQQPRESHYSRASNSEKLYLPATTTVTTLHRLFLDQNPQWNPNNGLQYNKITYGYFRKNFNEEFNISVGYPRSDLCNTCELIHKRIEVAREENRTFENLRQAQLSHWDSAETFYEEMRRCTTLGAEYLVLC